LLKLASDPLLTQVLDAGVDGAEKDR